MDFKYKIEDTADRRRLTLAGRLDTAAASDLEEGVKKIAAAAALPLVVDVTDLVYISSSGLRCLVQLYNDCHGKNVAMEVTGVKPAIKEIFDLTGFSKVFSL